MVVNEEINLGDPIDKFLPEDVKVPSKNGKKITLMNLANHTSGLLRMHSCPPPNSDLDKKYEFTKDRMYEFLSDFEIPRDIGSEYKYSNTGGSLLVHVLSLKEGKRYEQTLKNRTLDKLGMDSTCIRQCNGLQDRFAKPHHLGKIVNELNLPDEMAGAGGIRSSGKDMLEFLSYAMGLEDSELQKSFKLIQTVTHKIKRTVYIGLVGT